MRGRLGVYEGGQARVVQKYSFNNKERKGYKTSNDPKKERMMEGPPWGRNEAIIY